MGLAKPSRCSLALPLIVLAYRCMPLCRSQLAAAVSVFSFRCVRSASACTILVLLSPCLLLCIPQRHGAFRQRSSSTLGILAFALASGRARASTSLPVLHHRNAPAPVLPAAPRVSSTSDLRPRPRCYPHAARPTPLPHLPPLSRVRFSRVPCRSATSRIAAAAIDTTGARSLAVVAIVSS